MTTVKLALRLDSAVEAERHLLYQYNSLPRSRRQEFLRAVLLRGAAEPPKGGVPARASVPEVESTVETPIKTGRALTGLFSTSAVQP